MIINFFYKFNLLSKTMIIDIKILYRFQIKAIVSIYTLIKLSISFKIKKVVTKNRKFKTFIIKCNKKIVKNRINIVFSNSKFNNTSFKINLDIVKGFFILTLIISLSKIYLFYNF